MNSKEQIARTELGPSTNGGRIFHGRAGLGMVYLVFTILVVGLAAKTVVEYMGDDNHFMSAGYLLARGNVLYKDFAYFQMPYAACIYAVILKAGFISFSYLSLRLFNLLFVLTALLALYWSCKRISNNRLVGLACVLIFASSSQLREASNQLNSYAIANCFVLLSFFFIIRSNRHYKLSTLFSGVFLGVAIGSKLYYLTLLPAMLIFAFWPSEKLSLKKALFKNLIWLVGLAAALAPAGIFYFRNPEGFVFGNLGYHLLNTKWRELTGFKTGMTLANKIQFLTDTLGAVPFFCILLFCILAASRLYKGSLEIKDWLKSEKGKFLLLSLCLFTLALVASFTPTPLWNSYFLAPLPFALFTLASLWRIIGDSDDTSRLLTDIIIAALIVGILSLPPALYRILQASHITNWKTIAMHYQGRHLAQLLSERHLVGKVLSFENIFAIEGRLPIYNGMGPGDFGYRVGDLMTDELRERYHIVSSNNLFTYLDADPPVAILLGGVEFRQFEDSIIKYASLRDFEEVPSDIPGRRLFVRRKASGEQNHRPMVQTP